MNTNQHELEETEPPRVEADGGMGTGGHETAEARSTPREKAEGPRINGIEPHPPTSATSAIALVAGGALRRTGSREECRQEGHLSPSFATAGMEDKLALSPKGGEGDKTGRVVPAPVEPWPEPVDCGALLAELEGLMRRFLVLPEFAA